jgi:hypothetical protein
MGAFDIKRCRWIDAPKCGREVLASDGSQQGRRQTQLPIYIAGHLRLLEPSRRTILVIPADLPGKDNEFLGFPRGPGYLENLTGP